MMYTLICRHIKALNRNINLEHSFVTHFYIKYGLHTYFKTRVLCDGYIKAGWDASVVACKGTGRQPDHSDHSVHLAWASLVLAP